VNPVVEIQRRYMQGGRIMSYDLTYYDDDRSLSKAEREAIKEAQRLRLKMALDTELQREKVADIMWLGACIADEADDLADYMVRKVGDNKLKARMNFDILNEALNQAMRVQRQHGRKMER
jgi:hypothetical protein